jgi:hypothetical protein
LSGFTEIEADIYQPINLRGSPSEFRVGRFPQIRLHRTRALPATPAPARRQITPHQYNRGVCRSPSRYWRRSRLRHADVAPAAPEPQRLPVSRRADFRGDERPRQERAQRRRSQAAAKHLRVARLREQFAAISRRLLPLPYTQSVVRSGPET